MGYIDIVLTDKPRYQFYSLFCPNRYYLKFNAENFSFCSTPFESRKPRLSDTPVWLSSDNNGGLSRLCNLSFCRINRPLYNHEPCKRRNNRKKNYFYKVLNTTITKSEYSVEKWLQTKVWSDYKNNNRTNSKIGTNETKWIHTNTGSHARDLIHKASVNYRTR